MRSCIAIAISVFLAGMAQAGGDHTGGHTEGHTGGHMGGHGAHGSAAEGHATPLGMPAAAGPATRSVTVSMTETPDGGMVFHPRSLSFAAGETVRLLIRNEGQQEHEFIMGSAAEIAEHKRLMEAAPDMPHASANAIRLEPGASGEIVWNFAGPGRFEFACLILGHFEAGMHGPLVVE